MLAGVVMRVLLVCTGNICRSPVAEILLREHWGREWGVHLSSAGTQAHVGDPIYSPIRKLLIDRALPDGPFAGRQLTQSLVEAADLVLVMTREHRSAVVVLHPPAVRRTFTLREFARIAAVTERLLDGETLAQRLSSLVPLAARMRGAARSSADADAISDPYGRGEPACQRAVDQIEASVDEVIRVLEKSSRIGRS